MASGMTIQAFIEKAIEGGWKPQVIVKEYFYECPPGSSSHIRMTALYHELLDSLAWKAVGKVEGWYETEVFDMLTGQPILTTFWWLQMHRMIDALAEGKTIEQFLETL